MGPSAAFRNPAAIRSEAGDRKSPQGRGVQKVVIQMKDALLRVVTNEKLTRITHWTVFSVGALTLAFSVAATAARAF